MIKSDLNINWNLSIKDFLELLEKELYNGSFFIDTETTGLLRSTYEQLTQISSIYTTYKNGKFVAQISIDSTYTFLGNFDDEMTAHNEYIRYKINYAKILAERWKESIDIRVYQKLLNFNI